MKGEAKFEELSIIFAPSPIEVVTLSSDEDTPAATHGKGQGKLYPDVGPSIHAPMTDFDNHDTDRGKGKLIHQHGPSNHASMYAFDNHDADRYRMTMARPPRPMAANVNHILPISTHPKMTPLHMVDISDNSFETPPFNIWDYIEYFSDTESGATDISTANSYNYGARGQRSNLDRKKISSGNPKKCRTSAIDSCSPLPKEKC